MARIPIGTGVKAGWGILRLFRLFFFVLFFGYLFISIILTGIENRNFNFVIKELGEQFISPITTAQEFSLEMQNSDTDFWGSLWEYWGFYFQLSKIFIWIWIFQWLISVSPFSNKSNAFINWSLGIILVLMIQLVYITWKLGEDPVYLFTAIKDIFNGLIHIFTNFNFSDNAESSISIENNCNESVCIL